MNYEQVNIKVDKSLYPELAEKLYKLRVQRKVQRAFREFLKTYETNEKKQISFWE